MSIAFCRTPQEFFDENSGLQSLFSEIDQAVMAAESTLLKPIERTHGTTYARRTMKAAFKPKDNVGIIVTHGMLQKMSRGFKEQKERVSVHMSGLKSSLDITKLPFSRSSDSESGDESDSDGEGQGAPKARRKRKDSSSGWAKRKF